MSILIHKCDAKNHGCEVVSIGLITDGSIPLIALDFGGHPAIVARWASRGGEPETPNLFAAPLPTRHGSAALSLSLKPHSKIVRPVVARSAGVVRPSLCSHVCVPRPLAGG
jgi:hypothetical protein